MADLSELIMMALNDMASAPDASPITKGIVTLVQDMKVLINKYELTRIVPDGDRMTVMKTAGEGFAKLDAHMRSVLHVPIIAEYFQLFVNLAKIADADKGTHMTAGFIEGWNSVAEVEGIEILH